MNDNDKAGRSLVKRDSVGFFRWFLRNRRANFRVWIDARRLALPNQKDLTNDLVAALATDAGLEAMCLELESEARADALARALGYVARLWSEPADPKGEPIICVSGAILDLTGRSSSRKLELYSAVTPECRLDFTVVRRHLVDEDAAEFVAAVSDGEISPWQLPWVPLMQGGDRDDIILQWKKLAQQLSDESDQADLVVFALTFAALAKCRPVWEIALERWNMQTSPFWNEIRADGVRAMLLRLGRQKFGKTPTKKQQNALEAVRDLGHLEALTDRILSAKSWASLLGGTNGNGK